MDSISPERTRIHVHDDSRRWSRFVPRPDDIFISTPPKSGTTWTQGIVTSLLWPAGDAPAPAFGLSPWLDARVIPLDATIEALDTMDHRRFIKTHSPADCTPIYPTCRYLLVYRDPRDALVSWANHRTKMRPEVLETMNASAAHDGVAPWPPVWNGDMDQLLDEWIDWGTPMEHLVSWWPHRRQSYALFVHYADLSRDLDGEMRRIAAFLDITVPDDLWPDVVERCTFDSMKRSHKGSAVLDLAFDGGSASFFHHGTSDRWRDRLTPDQLRRHDAVVDAQLPDPRVRDWLYRGSLDLGRRPHEI
jgi:aryl sulfotransferase